MKTTEHLNVFSISLSLKQRGCLASEAWPGFSHRCTQLSTASDQQRPCLLEISIQHSLHVVIIEGGEARLRDIDGDAKL